MLFRSDLGNLPARLKPLSTGDLISGQPVVVRLGVGSYAIKRHAVRVAYRGVNQTASCVINARLNAVQLPICPLCTRCHSHSLARLPFRTRWTLADASGGF